MTLPRGSWKSTLRSCWPSPSCSGVPACNGRRWPYDRDTNPDFDTVSRSPTSPSGTPVVGDSVLVDTADPTNTNGFPTSVTVTVTAPAGTLLHYVCIIHQQMQGSIEVVG